MTRPDFIVIGHVVRDLAPGGWRLGGTAAFAAVQAQRLGLRAGIVTRVGPEQNLQEELPGIAVAGRPSRCTTSFENVYERGRRRQRVPGQAEPLDVDDVPEEWRSAPIELLGPVCGEVPAELGSTLAGALVGVSAQGWLRSLDRERRVRPRTWRGPPFWQGCGALFVSREDLVDRGGALDRWAAELRLVVVTHDREGARVHSRDGWRTIDAFPAREVDPTGAGDVFAAAFLVRYQETTDEAESARFAAAAAAFSVEGTGIERLATRAEVEARMERHPEIVLR